LAREGESLARYFLGAGARVIVTDQAAPEQLLSRISNLRGAELHVGGQFPELVQRADRFFVSPGVPPQNPVYRAAIARGLAVETMTTLFFDLCPAPIIGITGSSGKTTTTSLTGHILRTAREDVVVGGNIGDPMLDLLPHISPETRVVLELSSFQLETLHRSPHLALVTNISPNHLDRHGSMERYVEAKRRIVAHQGSDDIAVLNIGDPEVATFERSTAARVRWFGWDIGGHEGATVIDETVVVRSSEARGREARHGRDSGAIITAPSRACAVLPVSEVPLLGRHNLENVMAAVTAADALGISVEAAAGAIRSFQAPAHRLQVIGEWDGVKYVDDSIATSPTRAVVGLQAIEEPVILIAGGRDKQLPWDEFASVVAARARALLLIGEAAPQIEDTVRHALQEPTSMLRPDAIRRCGSLDEAVRQASALAGAGDAVLLSPGCTSYDMFPNFEARGAAFTRAVEALHAA
jgi:UDP-N-acetylmuramoylalanine--D-glutamate ligase